MLYEKEYRDRLFAALRTGVRSLEDDGHVGDEDGLLSVQSENGRQTERLSLGEIINRLQKDTESWADRAQELIEEMAGEDL